MATALSTQKMTLEEFYALPDDESVDRMLIRGVLVEEPMTKRNRWHAMVEARISALLVQWLDSQDDPPGTAFSGEVGCELVDGEDVSSVGIDVALFSNERINEQPTNAACIKGAPILAVEILSPADVLERIQQKTDVYLASGTSLVWIVDPHFRTVSVFSGESAPFMVSGDDFLTAEPHLPGFSVRVSEFFS